MNINVSPEDTDRSIDNVVRRLATGSENGIRELYPSQRKILHDFCEGQDIFYTGIIKFCFLAISSLIFPEATNAGKSLPPCLFPYLVEDLKMHHDVDLPSCPKCLFVTALNSIKGSLSMKLSKLGLDAEIITKENADELLTSKNVKVFLVSPEVMKQDKVTRALLCVAKDFVIKCIDEAHLFLSWGMTKRKGGKVFRPSMNFSSGELASLGGLTLLQTATATSRTVRILSTIFTSKC